MPIYDYECKKCNETLLDEFAKKYGEKRNCPNCNSQMQQLFPMSNGYVFPRDGITLEHVGPQPKTFRSKKEMVTFARENNMELGALL